MAHPSETGGTTSKITQPAVFLCGCMGNGQTDDENWKKVITFVVST
jgi:hypothetical protein